MVHVYTGPGKGKTTATLGLALRALGWGAKVCMIQFIKGYADIGEARFAREFGERFILKQFEIDLTLSITEREVKKRSKAAEDAFAYARESVKSGEFDLIILDEINNALHYSLIDKQQVLDLIETKPEHVELVLTGRDAPAEIIAAADYVTELVSVKHPFDKGIPARRGVDY